MYIATYGVILRREHKLLLSDYAQLEEDEFKGSCSNINDYGPTLQEQKRQS